MHIIMLYISYEKNYILIPFKALNYMVAEANYGGRVTDDKDVRLIKTILFTYMNKDVLTIGHQFSESGLYYSLAPGDREDYIDYIK